jgi:hypothetical protein
MLKTAGLLAMSALLLSASAVAQVQPRNDAQRQQPHPAVAGQGHGELMLVAGLSAPSEPDRIVLPSEIAPSMYRPINLGWHMQMNTPSCTQIAVNNCTAGCGDIGECIFGCEIGGINNPNVCSVDCSNLTSACLDSCTSTNKAITACSPLQITSFKVLFGSTSYTISPSSPAILPWNVNGIQVTFSEPVATGTINSLGGITATGFTGIGTNTLTWTFASTPSANVTVTLATSGIDMLSDLDGNSLEFGFPFSQSLKILWGDVNGDGVVNASDLVLTNSGTVQQYNILYDINGDGIVNAADVTAVRARLNTKLPTQP